MLTDGESQWNFLVSWIYSQFAKGEVKLITFLRYCMKITTMLWKHAIVDKYMHKHKWDWLDFLDKSESVKEPMGIEHELLI